MYAIKIGLWARDTYEGLKMFANNVSNNCYDTFEIPLGTNYQVPSGKILRCSFIISQPFWGNREYIWKIYM